MLLMATAAQAASVDDNKTTLRTAGYWTAWYDPSNADGKPMCGMRQSLDASNGATGGVMIKYVPGGNIFVQIYKSNWAIPAGTDVPIYVQFDNGNQYPVTAGGSPAPSGAGLGSWIHFHIADSFSKSFIELFMTGNTMTVGFREGSERPWPVTLYGSSEVGEAFRKCALVLNERQPKATQPYGTKPTQPFSGGNGATTNGAKPSKRDDGGI
ncbi:hypothetical protein Q2941_18585 [Bradyrhizobium sp. UFLA05-153]